MRKSRRKIHPGIVRRITGTLLTACILIFLVTPVVVGEATGRSDTKTVREILVPFEDLDVILQGDKERVLLSREEYEALMAKAEVRKEEEAPAKAVPVFAEYHVSVQEDRAVIAGTLKVEIVEEGLQSIPLEVGGIGLRGITIDNRPAAVGRDAAGRLRLFAQGVGELVVSLDAVTPLVTGAARQVLNFQLPTPSSTRLFVKVPGDVEVRSGAAVISRVFDEAASETRFELLPQKGQVSIVMSLNSRLKRRDRVVVARSVLIDEVTQAYERLHATVSFDILHGAVDDLSVSLPPAFEVTDVSSPHLSKWAVNKSNNAAVLDIKLRAETVGTVILNISAVRSSPGLQDWNLPIFEPQDAVSHASVVGLIVEDRLEAQGLVSDGLIPIDATVIKAALPKTVLDGEAGAARVRPVAAFYSPNSTYSLSADFVRQPAAFLLTANYVMQVRDSGLEINGGLSLLPKEEKLFAIDILAPNGWQVNDVTSSAGGVLAFERYKSENGSRIRVRLPRGLQEGQAASIAFRARHTPDGWLDSWTSRSLVYPTFSVPAADRDRGAIAVATGDDIVARPGAVENLLPLDQNEKKKFGLAGIPTSLAYSYRSQPYSAEVVVERMNPRLTAETYSFFRLERDVAVTRYEIVYDVTEARARSVVFSLPTNTPSSLSVIGLDGSEVKEYSGTVKEGGRRIWTATLADAQRGSIHLAVDLVLSMGGGSESKRELPVVRAENVNYQSGMIAIEGNAELDVRVLRHPRRVDVGELADAEYVPGSRLLGAFNFVGEPENVQIGISRRSPCFLPPAIIERSELASTISADGKSQSAMRFLVRSQAQFVEVRLPEGSVLWSVSVDGEPTKPRREDDSILISLPSRGNSIRDVQVVYESPMEPFSFWEKVKLDAPRLFFHSTGLGAGTEVPMADLKWDVFLPNGYEIGGSTGSVVSHTLHPPQPAAIAVARWLYEAAGGINIRRGLVGGCVMTAGHIAASREVVTGYKLGDVDYVAAEPSAPQLGDAVVMLDSAMPSDESEIEVPPDPVEAPIKEEGEQIKRPRLRYEVPPRKTALWAIKGISSLNIDLTRVGAGTTFQSIGVDPELKLRLIHQRRTLSLAWAVAGAIFVAGTALTSRKSSLKVLYVASVMIATMAVPVLPALAFLSLIMNYAFYAACWLVPYYIVAAFACRMMARRSASLLRRVATTVLVLFSLIILVPVPAVVAKEKRVAEPYIVQVAPPPEPVKVPADAIVVPYRDDTQEEDRGGRIMIPYKRFRELWELAYGKEDGAAKPPVSYALAGVEYETELLDGETLRLRGKLTMDVYGPTHAEIPLPLNGGVITSALLDGKPAKLTAGVFAVGQVDTRRINAPVQQLRQVINTDAQAAPRPQKAIAVLYIPGEGRHSLDISIDMRLTRKGGWRVAQGVIPSAPAASLSMEVPDAETDVNLDYVTDRRSYKTLSMGETIKTSVCPDGRFKLMWRPRVSEGETDSTLTASSAALFDIREDQLDLVWDLHLMFRRGERDSFTVKVPVDYVVEKVEGENVRGWAIDNPTGQADPGPRELKVDLLKRSVKEERFSLHLWKAGPVAAGGSEKIKSPVIAVPEAMRHTGKFTIRRSPLLDVRSLSVSALRRTDLQTGNYPGNVDKAQDESPLGIRPYESYEFVTVPFDIELSAQPTSTDLDARVNSIFRIAEDEHRLETRIDLTAKNRPIHRVEVEMPSRFDLDDVNTPVEYEWTVESKGDRNVLSIYFAAGLQGKIPIILKSVYNVEQVGQKAEIPSLTVLGVEEQEGDIVIQADPAYDVRAEDLGGLEPLLMNRVHGWLTAEQRFLARLAFHHRKPGYSGSLSLTRRKADVTCHTISNVRVTDKAIEETILINFNIRNAGIRRVEFRVPEHMKDAAVRAPLMREKTFTDVKGSKEVLVTLQLQDEVMREFSVLVESDRLLSSDLQKITVPSVLTGRTDRQYITLENAGRDEIVVERVSGLDPLGRQQKEWATVAPLVGGTMTTAYIAGSETKTAELAFRTKQRVAVETAGARIGFSQCVLIIDGEGAYRGEQTYRVDNQTEQFLETELPEGASLWTVVVAGELVKPVVGDPGNLRHVRIPLVKTAAGDLDYTVRLKYAGKLPAIRTFNKTSFPLLRTLNVNVELTQLVLRLPNTHRWGYFDGSMRQVTQAGDFEAGLLSYQTKLAKRLVKTLQYGNVFEKARAVSNLKGVRNNLMVYQESLNINPANDVLNTEVSNAGVVLDDATKELEKAREWEEEQIDAYDNRWKLNERFARQANTLSRNKVLDVNPNWDEGRESKPADVNTQAVFNYAWFDANGLVADQPAETDEAVASGRRVQDFGVQLGKGWKKSAKEPAAVEQKRAQTPGERGEKLQRKGKGQYALASRYKAKLEKQQQEMQNRQVSGEEWGDLGLDVNGAARGVVASVTSEAERLDAEGVSEDRAFYFGGVAEVGGGAVSGSAIKHFTGTGLASLDFNLPQLDPNRWTTYRFTTPLGEARVTARSISKSGLAAIQRFLLVAASLLLLFVARMMAIGVKNMRVDGADSKLMHHLPNILIIFGVIDLLAGILPVAAFWVLVVGVFMKIRRAYKRWRQLASV